MNRLKLSAFSGLILGFLALGAARGQSPSTNFQLRLFRNTDGLELIVDGNAESGALLIYRAASLAELKSNPLVALQTETLLTNGLRFSLATPDAGISQVFFKAAHFPRMSYIPAGTFEMGDTFNDSPICYANGETPVHTVQVGGFCMSKYGVTKPLWDEVSNWAIGHGYSFDYGAQGKAANHPAHSMTWYDAVKWCNARSEKEGLVPAYYTNAALISVYRTGQVSVQNDWVRWNTGYRLPTEAEREKAARGGISGLRFPWGNTISHAQANYYAYPGGGPCMSGFPTTYDVNPTRGYHPGYEDGVQPYTSPIDAFPANGHGLYDMAGNLWEWCWDRFD